jgi:Na+-translocating ferredoxin:NAD+ oxidoreductase RNF subunit RnfB
MPQLSKLTKIDGLSSKTKHMKDYIQRTEERFDNFHAQNIEIHCKECEDKIKTFWHDALTGLVEEIKGEVEGIKTQCEYCKSPVDESCIHYQSNVNASLDSVLDLLSSITSNDESK